MRFIVDANVGKLAKRLRLMGYDAIFPREDDDSQIVRTALAEKRIILTRDTQILKRRVVTSGLLKAVLLESDDPDRQMCQLEQALKLESEACPFTVCLECNQPLAAKTRDAVKDRVPSYVYRTQEIFMECPACHRVYWKGTHWKAMVERLAKLAECGSKEQEGNK